jgi:hypothetical protein
LLVHLIYELVEKTHHQQLFFLLMARFCPFFAVFRLHSGPVAATKSLLASV